MTIAAIIAAVVGLALLFVAWRTVRAFARLALFGFVALALVAAYAWWRWNGSGDTTPAPTRNERRQTVPARR